MKKRISIAVIAILFALPPSACGAPEAPRHSLFFTSGGETVRLEAAEVPDFSADVFAPSPADKALEKAAGTVGGFIKYLYDGALYDFSFDDGSAPVYEIYWFFKNGALAASGPAGVTPEEEGRYLVYVDFLFADGGGVTARRTAVWMDMSHADRAEFAALRAAGVPRGLVPGGPPLSESHRAYLESSGDTVLDAGTDDPAEALRQLILLERAEELASGDPFYKLEDARVLSVSPLTRSYLDGYGAYLAAYQSAVKPASPEYHLLQYPMDTNIPGTGELGGWLLADGVAFLRYYGGGVWRRFDNVWGISDYPPQMGMSSLSGGGMEKEYPSAEFLAGDPAEFAAQPWFLLENPEKIDWAQAKAEYGADYCQNLFALVYANAFNSLPNRAAAYGGVLGELRYYPQAMRTAAVMLAANSVSPELEEGYAALLRELRTADPGGYAYCLTQLPAGRAAEVEDMTK